MYLESKKQTCALAKVLRETRMQDTYYCNLAATFLPLLCPLEIIGLAYLILISPIMLPLNATYN